MKLTPVKLTKKQLIYIHNCLWEDRANYKKLSRGLIHGYGKEKSHRNFMAFQRRLFWKITNLIPEE